MGGRGRNQGEQGETTQDRRREDVQSHTWRSAGPGWMGAVQTGGPRSSWCQQSRGARKDAQVEGDTGANQSRRTR